MPTTTHANQDGPNRFIERLRPDPDDPSEDVNVLSDVPLDKLKRADLIEELRATRQALDAKDAAKTQGAIDTEEFYRLMRVELSGWRRVSGCASFVEAEERGVFNSVHEQDRKRLTDEVQALKCALRDLTNEHADLCRRYADVVDGEDAGREWKCR